ncbi:hypothetical protein D9M68_881800 [compost metagenome]
MALHGSASRRVGPEIALVDAVEAPEITRIIQPDAAAHHMLEPVAGLFEDGDDVLDGEVGLLDNPAIDDLAILHGHLARHIEPATGFYCAGEGQVLSTCTGLVGTVAFDRHCSHSSGFLKASFVILHLIAKNYRFRPVRAARNVNFLRDCHAWAVLA